MMQNCLQCNKQVHIHQACILKISDEITSVPNVDLGSFSLIQALDKQRSHLVYWEGPATAVCSSARSNDWATARRSYPRLCKRPTAQDPRGYSLNPLLSMHVLKWQAKLFSSTGLQPTAQLPSSKIRVPTTIWSSSTSELCKPSNTLWQYPSAIS